MRRASSVGSIRLPPTPARKNTAHPALPSSPAPDGPRPGQAACLHTGDASPGWLPLDPALQQLLPRRWRQGGRHQVCAGAGGLLEVWGRRSQRLTAWLALARRVLRLLHPFSEHEIDSLLPRLGLDLAAWGRLDLRADGAALRIGGGAQACVRVLSALLTCADRGLLLACRFFACLRPQLQGRLLRDHGALLVLIDRRMRQEQEQALEWLDVRQAGTMGSPGWRQRRDCVQAQQALQDALSGLCGWAVGRRDWALLALALERCPGWIGPGVLDAVAFQTHHLGLDRLLWAEPRLGRAVWALRLQAAAGERPRFALSQPFFVGPRLAWVCLRIEHAARWRPETEHLAVLRALGELARAARGGSRQAGQDLVNGLLLLARTGWAPLPLAMGLLLSEPADAALQNAALKALRRAGRQARERREIHIAEAFAAAVRQACANRADAEGR